MNVLVVDDEPIIRVALRSLIDWESHGLQWAGDASNGADAWELIDSGQVDILITDLLMPIMDGLELLGKIKSSNKDISSIVLSCLDDFNWVKEAMKLGAKDYILKPTMEPEQLTDIVKGVRDDLQKQRSEKKEMDRLREQAELSKQVQLAHKLQLYLRQGHLDASLEEELFNNGATPLGSLLLYASSDMNRLALVNWESLGVRTAVNLDSDKLLLLVPFTEAETLHEQAAEVVALAEAELGNQAEESDWFVGIGLKLYNLSDLSKSVQWHTHQSISRFYRISAEGGRLMHDPPVVPVEGSLPYESRQDLLRSLAHDNVQAVRHRAKELADQLKGCYRPKAEVGAFVSELLTLALGYAQEQGYSPEIIESFERSYLGIEAIKRCHSIHQLSELLFEAFEDISYNRLGISSSRIASSRNPFIKRAVRYMLDHYHRNISTLEIAEHVRLSRSYLSYLFSKETGQTLSEALTLIRIEKAKRRLSLGEMKVYEIAEAVGYPDAKSFAKIFKRTVGCSPKDYISGANRDR